MDNLFKPLLKAMSISQILGWVEAGWLRDHEVLKVAYNIITQKIISGESEFVLEEFNSLEARVLNRDRLPLQVFDPEDVINGPSTSASSGLTDRMIPSQQLEPFQATPSTSRTLIPLQQHGGTIPPQHLGQHEPAPSTSRTLIPLQQHGGTGPVTKAVDKYIKISSEGEKLIKKFNLVAKTLVFKFKDLDASENPIIWLQKAFDEVIAHVTQGSKSSDRIGMILRNDRFPDRPCCFSFRKVDQLSAAVILATLEKILQSNVNFFANDTMRLHVDRITLPTGAGRAKLTGVDFREYCFRKTGIMVVVNEDTYCLARAIVLAIAWRSGAANLPTLRMGGPLMRREAFDLCEAAGVDLTNGGNLDHIQQFQQYLTRYTVVVYNSRNGKSVYFEGPRAQDRTVLNLIFENEHYNVITNFSSAFACTYFCEMCRIRFSKKRDHKNCKYICPCCHASPPCDSWLDLLKCNVCNRDFHGAQCFAEHSKQLCKSLQRCRTCLASVWIDAKKPHRCGYKLCFTCNKDQPIRHLCHMSQKKANIQKLGQHYIFTFYDFECTQDTLVEGTTRTFLHEPNLCVAQNVCKTCLEYPDMSQACAMCGVRQHVFKQDPVKNFLNYISRLASGGSQVVALAHNMKGYDGTFIMRELIKDVGRWNPKIISNGTKLMTITCNNIKFIDSLNFMAMPLAKLPETFKFTGSKGYFPYLFNTKANQNYIGDLPALEHYRPDELSSKNRDSLLKWHAAELEKNALFDMQHEIVKYCVSDVDILRKACLDFWKLFSGQNGVDPFRETCTIAGACMTVFRRNFLQPDTIGIIPRGGYRMADKQSAVAIRWLLWTSYDSGLQIQHAGNNREVRLKENFLVDGFCEATNTVYNFHGCYYHGCERCFPDQHVHIQAGHDSMSMRRKATVAASARIRSHGYNLVEMWECSFKTYLLRNPRAAEFVANHDCMKGTPLSPRDAFFGGRTNAVKLYYEVGQGEEIRYLDVCSLYPFVNKYAKYPIGHPKVYIGDAECRQLPFDTVEGLIKATILPPSNLYHPVLPYRLHSKLMFILCRSCGDTLNQGECTHTQNERKFTGTYVADELRKAVELGYQVLEFHEVWSYQVTQYDKDSKSGGWWSSGWPSWCTSDSLKDVYIEEYLQKEGVALEKGNISFNAGLRYIAKLILNSFWGKLAQRENLNQTSILSEPNELFKMLTDPSIDVQSLIEVNDDVFIVNWLHHEEGATPLDTVNVVLAAYTTAFARLELYKYLEKLGKRVLYFDTDSVLFTQKIGEWAPPVGDFLGDMTDEIEKDFGTGSKIIEFVSGGPKNYAFKVEKVNSGGHAVVCKVKGITLNYKNSREVNLETLKNLVLNNLDQTYVETDRKIVRTSTYDVVSKPERKIYRVQYNKRRRKLKPVTTLSLMVLGINNNKQSTIHHHHLSQILLEPVV